MTNDQRRTTNDQLVRVIHEVRRAAAAGALGGALLTAPLIALWFAGWKVFDLPFPPFDLFDWIARALPGRLVTIAIDGFVAAFAALHVSPVTGAKLVEQLLAVALVVLAGTSAGALVFSLLTASGEPAALFGAILGAMCGGFIIVMEDTLNRLTTPGAFASGLWLFATTLAWGVMLGRLSERVGRVSAAQPERRAFLIRVGNAAAATTLGTTVIGALAEQGEDDGGEQRWSSANALPNANDAVMPVPGTRREFTPVDEHYRIDVNTRAPALNRQRWRLRVGGVIGPPISFSLDQLRRFEPLHQFATLSCISNPPGGDLVSTTRWTGVSLQRLLSRLRVPALATHLKVTAADGFFEVVALEDVMADPRIMLAYAWDGVPLPLEHGRPLRLYVPDRYGMKLPKWIVAIDAIDHWEAGYWVSRGWDREGRVKATAAVDAISLESRAAVSVNGGERKMSVGGVAFAGARGVSKVEVQVDGGEWRAATLRGPLSGTTWVVWRAEWPVPVGKSGEIVVTARCFEADGTFQTGPLHTRRFAL